MPELLLEILSEEIPARMQARAAEDLARLLGEGLKAQGLGADKVRSFAGPRRLCAVADGVPAAQADVTEERKGPQVGAPEQAIAGFLRASGLKSLDDAEIRELPKGKFYFAVVRKPGRATAIVLREVIEAALAQLSWPKSMRWGTNAARWVRPLHGIVCLFDGAVVPVSFAGISAGDVTVGHRFLAPGEFAVTRFADYAAKLKRAYVILDAADRSAAITEGLGKLAAAENLVLPEDPYLVTEVAGLVEWPVGSPGTELEFAL